MSAETVGLPDGWEWAEPEWHPLDDPIWKSYRMAHGPAGQVANFESRIDRSATAHADSSTAGDP